MKNSITNSQLLGFGVISLFGIILHFLYDLTGGSVFVAPFSGVNESTFEHMKLLFFPMFVYALVQSRFLGKEYANFWCVKLRGTLLGLALIPVVFYTYNGAFGKSPDFLNIAIFFISAAIALIYEAKKFGNDKIKCSFSKIAFLLMCAIGVLFVLFTFSPPQLPLFLDPLTKTYGLNSAI